MTQINQLEAWIAEENVILEKLQAGPGPGVSRLDQIVGMSGMQIMQAALEGKLPFANIAHTLDFRMIEVGPGRTVYQGTPGLAHLNPMGSVHGGWFAAMLDSALGCAVHTMMPVGRAYTTAELSIHLVKALTPKVQRVRAIGTVVHCGRQLATAEARLVGPDGTLYAHATTSCLVFDMPTAK